MNMYLYTYRLFWLLENEYLIGVVCGVESNVTGIVATLSIDIMNQKRPAVVSNEFRPAISYFCFLGRLGFFLSECQASTKQSSHRLASQGLDFWSLFV